MNIIKKSTANLKKENLIYIGKDFKRIEELGLSKDEADFIRSKFQNKSDSHFVYLQRNRLMAFVQTAGRKSVAGEELEYYRKAGNALLGSIDENKISSVTICGNSIQKSHYYSLAEGLRLGAYKFLKYVSTADAKRSSLKEIAIASGAAQAKDVDTLNILCEATEKARDLVNEPVNFLNAEGLAKAFVSMGKESGFSTEVLTKSKIESLKMGGLLAVNQGSIDPPTFSIMEWKPRGAKNKKPYVLIGKGLVYDTGGLSLKPTPNSMDSMKCDMAGGAAVGATMYAIAKAKLPIHVIGLVPSTDNRPGENAFAPGDIIRMHDGSTVEMLNSDAEGRMILADALSYAKKYSPALVIDLATLTGAAAAAIGHYGIVCMGNCDDRFKNRLKKSGDNAYERLVEFPFWNEYNDLLKSEIADMKNIGGPVGGAITAGKFLEKFTNYPYMHFDIAGPAFLNAKDSYRPKGGTGSGVRLLFDFFKNL